MIFNILISVMLFLILMNLIDINSAVDEVKRNGRR